MWVLGGNPMHDPAPETSRIENVCLVDARDPAASLAGRRKGTMRDALDFVLVVAHDVMGMRASAAIRAGSRDVFHSHVLAKIQTAGKLAHDEDIAAAHRRGLERRGVEKCVIDVHRSQVRVEAELLANAEQPVFGPWGIRIDGIPARAANGTEQHRVRTTSELDGLAG